MNKIWVFLCGCALILQSCSCSGNNTMNRPMEQKKMDQCEEEEEAPTCNDHETKNDTQSQFRDFGTPGLAEKKAAVKVNESLSSKEKNDMATTSDNGSSDKEIQVSAKQ